MSVIVDIWWSQLDGEYEGVIEAEQQFRFELRCSFFYDASWPGGAWNLIRQLFFFFFLAFMRFHERSEHQTDLFDV